MGASVDDEVTLDVGGFGVGFNQELFGVDVKCDGLQVVDECFECQVVLLLLHVLLGYVWVIDYCL